MVLQSQTAAPIQTRQGKARATPPVQYSTAPPASLDLNSERYQALQLSHATVAHPEGITHRLLHTSSPASSTREDRQSSIGVSFRSSLSRHDARVSADVCHSFSAHDSYATPCSRWKAAPGSLNQHWQWACGRPRYNTARVRCILRSGSRCRFSGRALQPSPRWCQHSLSVGAAVAEASPPTIQNHDPSTKNVASANPPPSDRDKRLTRLATRVHLCHTRKHASTQSCVDPLQHSEHLVPTPGMGHCVLTFRRSRVLGFIRGSPASTSADGCPGRPFDPQSSWQIRPGNYGPVLSRGRLSSSKVRDIPRLLEWPSRSRATTRRPSRRQDSKTVHLPLIERCDRQDCSSAPYTTTQCHPNMCRYNLRSESRFAERRDHKLPYILYTA